MTTSPAFVIRGNIERYRHLIADERDDVRRDTIIKLLAEAEADLKALEKDHKPQGSRVEPSASDASPE